MPIRHNETVALVEWRLPPSTGQLLGRIVVGTGPGSFTSLRIGLAASRTLALARFSMAPPELPPLPDFLTQHIDPFTGDDDTYDIDAGTGAILSRLPPLQTPQPDYPAPDGEVIAPPSRNAPCPCGSGRKYKHCHGAVA